MTVSRGVVVGVVSRPTTLRAAWLGCEVSLSLFVLEEMLTGITFNARLSNSTIGGVLWTPCD
jgi:hypothetical protein